MVSKPRGAAKCLNVGRGLTEISEMLDTMNQS